MSFFSWQLNIWNFFLLHFIARFFFHTHICPFNSLLWYISTKNSHVAPLNYIPVQLYTRYITVYDIKLIYTGAEKGIKFVECTELELAYYDFCIFPFICF